MEGSNVFTGAAVGIYTIIETDWANRQLVAQTQADGVTHIVETGCDSRERIV
jgi:hypothetical protein